MISRKWRIDVSAYGPEDSWRDIASQSWTPGSPLPAALQALPAEVQEALLRFQPLADERGFSDIRVGELLYRVEFREA